MLCKVSAPDAHCTALRSDGKSGTYDTCLMASWALEESSSQQPTQVRLLVATGPKYGVPEWVEVSQLALEHHSALTGNFGLFPLSD